MATSTKSRRSKAIQAVVTVCKFTDTTRPFEVIRPGCSFDEFSPISPNDYWPKGDNTPLRDATARFINYLETLKRPDVVVIGLLVDESLSMFGEGAAVIQGANDYVTGMAKVKKIDPAAAGTVLAVITTDGEENRFHEVTPEALKGLVSEKEEEGWTFIFMGAEIDAWHVGMSTVGLSGGVTGQMVSHTKSPAGVYAAMSSITTDSASYLTSNAQYKASRSGSSMRSVTDTGEETLSNINSGQSPYVQSGSGVPNVTVQNITFNSPYANADEALKKARKATGFPPVDK